MKHHCVSWQANNGPTLNAGLVALRFFRGSAPVLLRNPCPLSVSAHVVPPQQIYAKHSNNRYLQTVHTRCCTCSIVSVFIVCYLGDNCVQNFHLGRYIVTYTVVEFSSTATCKQSFKMGFPNVYPTIYLLKYLNMVIPILMQFCRLVSN